MSGGSFFGGGETKQTQNIDQTQESSQSAQTAARTGTVSGQQGQTFNISGQQAVLPDYIEDFSRAQLELGMDAASQPYTPYTGPRLAQFNADDQAAFDLARSGQGIWGADVEEAGALARGVGAYETTPVTTAMWSPEQLSRYMDPFTGEVIDSTLALYDEDATRRRNQLQMEAARSGAFGGGRHGVAEAEFDRGSLLDRANIAANLRTSGYDRALGAFQTDAGRQLTADTFNESTALANEAQRLQAAGALSGLGQQRAALNYADAEALSNIGAQQRALEQAGYDIAYGDYLEQRDWPIRQLNIMRSALSGVPVPVSTVGANYGFTDTINRGLVDQLGDSSSSGLTQTTGTNTATTTQPGGSAFGGLAGLLTTGAGIAAKAGAFG